MQPIKFNKKTNLTTAISSKYGVKVTPVASITKGNMIGMLTRTDDVKSDIQDTTQEVYATIVELLESKGLTHHITPESVQTLVQNGVEEYVYNGCILYNNRQSTSDTINVTVQKHKIIATDMKKSEVPKSKPDTKISQFFAGL